MGWWLDYMKTVYWVGNINIQLINFCFKMNDPMFDLQPILSSEEQEQEIEGEIKNSERGTLHKGHSIKEYMFNIKYNLMHSSLVYIPYFHRPKITLDPDSEPAYLLGTAYQNSSQHQFLAHFRSIVWMSYRTTSQAGKSDVGWGCMIRVVQMLFAENFKRENPKINVNHIIDLFKQGKNHILSLENICARGNIRERWTGSNEILLAVSSILGEYRAQDKFKQSVSSKNPQKINLDLNIQIFCEHITIQNFEQLQPQKQFPKLIVISSKVTEEGCSYFPEIYSSHAKHLMKMPSFCGMLGGVSNQALYIVGFQDEKVICLDPHYVQDEDEPDKVRYFKSTPRGLSFGELCPSVSFCFHFRNLDEYRNWAGEMCHAHKVYSPYLVMSMEVQSPEDMIEKYRKRSEDFQIL